MAQKARVRPHPGHSSPVTALKAQRPNLGREPGWKKKLKASAEAEMALIGHWDDALPDRFWLAALGSFMGWALSILLAG
jgi:hypothetical protein